MRSEGGPRRRPAAPRPTRAEIERTWRHARASYSAEAIADYELLRRHRPDVFHGYLTLRHATAESSPYAALDKKTRELILLAIQCARPHSGRPPTHHAVRAIDAGATPGDVADVVALCILVAGMTTYQQTGRFALRAAEDRAREIRARSKGRR